MRLFNRQKSSDIPIELQPYYSPPVTATRGWVRWIVRSALILVIVLLLGLLVKWAWHESHTTNKKTPSSTSSQAKSPTPAHSNQTPSSSSSSSTSSSSAQSNPSASNTTPATTPTTTGQSSAANNPLPNTGPSGTLTIFIIATTVGVGVYQLRLRKQTN